MQPRNSPVKIKFSGMKIYVINPTVALILQHSVSLRVTYLERQSYVTNKPVFTTYAMRTLTRESDLDNGFDRIA